MATTVQTAVTDNQALVPFFYLRITGLPFYVFSTVNPSDSRYGSFAWSAPTDFPSTWAQRGLQLPSEAIDQKLPDIIGGVATPAHARLSVIDFPDPVHTGFGYFSRLFAPGRSVSDSSIAKANLRSSVDVGSVAPILTYGRTGTFSSNSDIYIGAETVGIGTATDNGGGLNTLAIAKRNKYVCYGNTGDGGNCWPPIPYHTVLTDASSNIISPTPVTVEASDTLGRTAALWMGHMRPDGNPEPETSSTCLLLGRITNIGVGKVGGMFDIEIESIVSDLTKGKVAPDLAHGTIQSGFYLQSAAWCTFYVSQIGAVTITPGIYRTPQLLANAINTAMGATGATWLTLELVSTENGATFGFTTKDSAITTFAVASVPISATGTSAVPGASSLIHALGFDPGVSFFEIKGATGITTILAQRPAASVFVPALDSSQEVSLSETSTAGRFFTDQGDGISQAFARFGGGQIIKLNSTDSSANTVTTGGNLFFHLISSWRNSQAQIANGNFYYVEPGDTATIDQIVMYSQLASSTGGYTKFLGRLLASTTGHTSTANGILNVYPKFVGLGWNVLLTAADWLQNDEPGTTRGIFIDSATKWIDLFKPYSREHGLFLSWDPSTSKVSLRRITVPQGASAGVNVVFSESNRASADDRTSQRVDRSSIRTSWKIQPALARSLASADKPPALVINDTRARSMYPNDDRQEEIDDPSLIATDQVGYIIGRLVQTYATPWTLCSRTMNKRGMLLSPGTIHKVIDNTLINPFTGASGITTGDDVYCFLTRVSVVPSEGQVTIEFVINSTDDISLYRQWSPTALVDVSLNSGGYTRGYNSGTKTLSTILAYGITTADAQDFAIGDTVAIINRDSSFQEMHQTDTIAGVSGATITLTTGISAVSTVCESLVVLQKYNSATTTRKTGATKVAWQGSGDASVIQGSSTARLNRWS